MFPEINCYPDRIDRTAVYTEIFPGNRFPFSTKVGKSASPRLDSFTAGCPVSAVSAGNTLTDELILAKSQLRKPICAGLDLSGGLRFQISASEIRINMQVGLLIAECKVVTLIRCGNGCGALGNPFSVKIFIIFMDKIHLSGAGEAEKTEEIPGNIDDGIRNSGNIFSKVPDASILSQPQYTAVHCEDKRGILRDLIIVDPRAIEIVF